MSETPNNESEELSKHYTVPELVKHSAIPILTTLLASAYMIVDGLFIANYTSQTSYAGCILVTPYMLFFASIGFMVGGGGNALIGKLIGEKQREKAVDVFSMLVEFTIITVVLASIIGGFFLKTFLVYQKASGELFDEAFRYGVIVMVGAVFLALQYEFQLFLITSGRELRAFSYTVFAGVTNIGLDALFILVFHMGVAGAAIATVTGQFLGAALPFFFYMRAKNLEGELLYFKWTRLEKKPIIDTCVNGLSEMAENLAESVVSVIYNHKLMVMAGEAGVDAYGSVMYVFMLFTLSFVGFDESVVPIIGYKLGAGDEEELKGLIKRCLIVLFSYSVVFFILTELLAKDFSMLYSGGNMAVYELTVNGFDTCSLSLIFMGCSMFIPSMYTGLNDGWLSTLMSVIQVLILPAMVVSVLPPFLGVDGVWWSQNIAWMLAAVTCLIAVRIAPVHKYIKREEALRPE
ncbi:MAG: polysaccharide biosynthesis C-terminal domain-containing protein [Lachnospiraceae bacterium]|nr:polysaccharide biosynthesis C-terminal domain-containing protein [Lachnospiraceae bacterium]